MNYNDVQLVLILLLVKAYISWYFDTVTSNKYKSIKAYCLLSCFEKACIIKSALQIIESLHEFIVLFMSAGVWTGLIVPMIKLSHNQIPVI